MIICFWRIFCNGAKKILKKEKNREKKLRNGQKLFSNARKIIDKRNKMKYNTYSKEKDRGFLSEKRGTVVFLTFRKVNGFFMSFCV